MGTRRLGLIGLVLSVPVLVAACGGSSGSASESATPAADDSGVVVEGVERVPDASSESDGPLPEVSLLDFLTDTPGEDVAIVPGGMDYAVGENRVSFIVLRSDASQVLTESAEVLVGRTGAELPDPSADEEFGALGESDLQLDAGTIDATPIATSEAELITIGAGEPEAADTQSAEQIDIEQLYVTELTFDEPGFYWIVAQPEGEDVQAFGILQVRADPVAPGVGEAAFPSDNPTLDDARARDITTQSPPDLELLRYSVQDSLEAGVPFVVTFATPEFCVSRVCGPVVDVVDLVRSEFEETGVRFIQVEIYQDNQPDLGVNQWVAEWNLNSEPWTFLVDGDGIIQGRFEGAFSADELRQAVAEKLPG